LIGATGEEIDAAVSAVRRAKSHPVLKRAAIAARSGFLRREIPVMLMDDQTLAEGVVDLAFREETSDFAGWIVVDFKTDREFIGAGDRYVRQVQLYTRAISVATKLPVRGALLVI
jgi:ATP-dependent exoDNAse (exonuclease V) beta subunit